MIGYLRGKILRNTPDQVIVDTGGVGYVVSIPINVGSQLDLKKDVVEFHIHTYVREDQISLFGFANLEQLQVFRMLIEVDGVGPKVALAILGSSHLDMLKQAIINEDPGPIRAAPGVGAKTAAKIILELKSKLEERVLLPGASASKLSEETQVVGEVEMALRALGYSALEARTALDRVDWQEFKDAQSALAMALKGLAQK